MATERTDFLLYESIVLRVTATNASNDTVLLNGPGNTSWLEFLILRADGSKIRAEQDLSLPPEKLEPGASVTKAVDLTPAYVLRSTGQYEVRAVVRVPGRNDFVTSSLRINIGAGSAVWSRTFRVDGVERTVSAIRFLESRNTSIYLRVEQPQENVVYPTRRLGNYVAFTDVAVEIDADYGIHVLQPVGTAVYRYTRASFNGQILHQEDREVAGSTPRLTRQSDGSVAVAGGRGGSSDSVARSSREKLSVLQQGL